MINHFAFCILSTWLRARIHTSLVYASSILFALWVNHTFWPTIGRWSHVIWKTWTYRLTIYVSAYCINATRRWVANINNCNIFFWKHNFALRKVYLLLIRFNNLSIILTLTWNNMAYGKRISTVTLFAVTRWFVICYIAIRIISTHSRTWIYAFISTASQ